MVPPCCLLVVTNLQLITNKSGLAGGIGRLPKVLVPHRDHDVDVHFFPLLECTVGAVHVLNNYSGDNSCLEQEQLYCNRFFPPFYPGFSVMKNYSH